MNLKEEKYSSFSLIREMLETPGIIGAFDPKISERFVKPISAKKGIFLAGEGSSRLFPAKRAIWSNLKKDFMIPVITEGCTQSMEYKLDDFAVFLSSNSGQTKEVIRLANFLKASPCSVSLQTGIQSSRSLPTTLMYSRAARKKQ